MKTIRFFQLLLLLSTSSAILLGISSCSTAPREGESVRHYYEDIGLAIGQQFRIPARPTLSMPDLTLVPLRVNSEASECFFRAKYGTGGIPTEAWVSTNSPFTGFPYLESLRMKLLSVTSTGVTLRIHGAINK